MSYPPIALVDSWAYITLSGCYKVGPKQEEVPSPYYLEGVSERYSGNG